MNPSISVSLCSTRNLAFAETHKKDRCLPRKTSWLIEGFILTSRRPGLESERAQPSPRSADGDLSGLDGDVWQATLSPRGAVDCALDYAMKAVDV